ncbi:MAG: beta-phosphoglucomutase family hydrolase [Phycisphaerae bacterium]|nr:beta-phosphoglucomutase family hydrolase [Phycisphaerae bacterium]MDW8261931.1 beta-phosphoglucomutase family hydrolase [Phycisphaerales bacterium]
MKFDIPDDVGALIFDCDGTLADTMPLHYQAWSAAMKHHGAEFPEALFWEMAGIPTARIIQLLNEKHGWDVPVAEAAELKERLYVELIDRVKVIQPVADVVLQYAGKLPMAVATGGTRAIVTRTLTAVGLLEHFQAIVTADDVAHGKPAPDIFLESARRLGVPAARCLVFEDADLGVQAAQAAGMRVIDIRRAGPH